MRAQRGGRRERAGGVRGASLPYAVFLVGLIAATLAGRGECGTLSVTSDSSTIAVEDGTRKWVWKNEAGKPVVAEFYHASVGSGAENCGTTSSSYPGPGFGVVPYWGTLTSSSVFSVDVSSGTVVRVHRKCSSSKVFETWQAVQERFLARIPTLGG